MMDHVFNILCCAIICLATVQGKLLTDPLPKDAVTCTYYGQTYQVGEEFQPNPCTDCHCDDAGHARCAFKDCPMPACVDAVFDPTQCCPVCPAGSNCRTFDGTLISSGEEVTLSSGAKCRCPVDGSMHWGSQTAICSHTDSAVPDHGDPFGPTHHPFVPDHGDPFVPDHGDPFHQDHMDPFAPTHNPFAPVDEDPIGSIPNEV